MKRISKAVLIAVSIFMIVSGMTIKADENIKTITSWSFSDEGLIKEDKDNTWYLHVEESSLEDIETMLPETITAEFSDEEENISGEETTNDEIGSSDNKVNITWNSADIDPSLDSQELYASLPPNYVLANSEEKIALTLIIDKDDPDIEEETDTMIDDETDTIIDDETETVIEEESITTYSITDFDDLIINEPKPSGTVINLFDYWSANRGTEQKNITEEEATSGINKDHSLKFGNQLGQADDNEWTKPASKDDIAISSINSWTKSALPHTGIVNNKLYNGYPILIEEKNANLGENISGSYQIDDAITTEESLDYLFSPNISHDGKEIHRDAKGLLTIDDNGYYHFDSKNTFAKYNDNNNSFTLYNTSSETDSKNCQFFPFNDIDHLFNIENGALKIDESVDLQGNTVINHFFGMTMTTKFIQPVDGASYNDEPITYNFSGDDDVWIFIDDVLVADLGGIHDALSVEINFQSGKVIVYNDANQNNKYDRDNDELYDQSTLRDIFTIEGITSNLDGDTFAADTYHTLKFFYLERGGNESNLSLRFNLIPVPESEITKVDQEGNPIAGVGFALYGADKEYQYDENNPIWEGSSDENGSIIITDKETGRPITFAGLHNGKNTKYDYYVLVEKDRPKGYSGIGEHHIKYEVESGVVFSDDHFETSSYAQPRVTTSLKDTIYDYDNSLLYTFDGKSELPTVHALVFKKVGERWVPVTGNIIDGWKVWNNNDDDAIAAAIKDNDGNNTFIPTTNGMQVTIENLPGDIKNYYWYIIKTTGTTEDAGDAEYNVRYYYEDDAGNMTRIADSNLDRVFSTHVIVSNTKNYLAVEKVDEDGKPLNGVSFALYEGEDIIKSNVIDTDNKVDYEKLKDLDPYDSGMTANLSRENGQKLNGEGLIVFPSEGKILEKGTYYFIETVTLDGYIRNDIATKIIVDDDGVFADAGKEDDGIKTRVFVGSILKSMLRFVDDDDKGIDTTLSSIKVQLTNRGESAWDASAPTVHLKYNNNRNEDEWGLEFDDYQNGMENLVSDSGTNKLIIRQCTQHKGEEGNYTNLNDSDISNLFSTLTYVIYTNDKVDNTDGGNESQKPESPSTDNDPDDDRPINDHDELTCAEKYGDGYIWSDEYNACIPGAIVIVDTSAR